MKVWMLSLSLIAMLGLTALADAKGTGKKKDHGTRGTIATVTASNNSFTMTVGNKKTGTQTLTVNAANATITIDGAAGQFQSLAAGQKIVVEGARDADTITATTITQSGHKKKNKNA